MSVENQRVPMEQVNIEDARREMLFNRLKVAGWGAFGVVQPSTFDYAAFWRDEGRYTISPQEAAIRLKLAGGEGNLPAGYTVFTDKGTDLLVKYTGEHDERYDAFVEDLVALGAELNDQQETEAPSLEESLPAARDAYASGEEAVADFLKAGSKIPEATNKLMRQLERAETGDGTLKMLIEAGISRKEAIAGIVEVAAGIFYRDETEDIWPEEADFLRAWQDHIVRRFEDLHSSAKAQTLLGAANTEKILGTLSAIGLGVGRAGIRSRELAAKLKELKEVADKIGPEAAAAALDDAATLADPQLQESIKAADRGEVVDITPSDELENYLSAEEARKIFDEQAQRNFGINGDEFMRKWKAGEFDDQDTPEVSRMAMLIPLWNPTEKAQPILQFKLRSPCKNRAGKK